MGFGGGSSAVETTVPNNPAVARSVEKDSTQAQQTQAEARQRLRGIRSTFNRFGSVDEGGTTSKLG